MITLSALSVIFPLGDEAFSRRLIPGNYGEREPLQRNGKATNPNPTHRSDLRFLVFIAKQTLASTSKREDCKNLYGECFLVDQPQCWCSEWVWAVKNVWFETQQSWLLNDMSIFNLSMENRPLWPSNQCGGGCNDKHWQSIDRWLICVALWGWLQSLSGRFEPLGDPLDVHWTYPTDHRYCC